jgi:preprotein translocase subunit SecA
MNSPDARCPDAVGRTVCIRRWKQGRKDPERTQTYATITFRAHVQEAFRHDRNGRNRSVGFDKIYKLDVVVIPTTARSHRKSRRGVPHRKEKFSGKRHHAGGHLRAASSIFIIAANRCWVGTISIEKSEAIAEILTAGVRRSTERQTTRA